MTKRKRERERGERQRERDREREGRERMGDTDVVRNTENRWRTKPTNQ